MEKWQLYLAVASIGAVWIFIGLTIYCYCPLLSPQDITIPFKAIVIIGIIFWIMVTALAFKNGMIRRLISLLSLFFVTFVSFKFIPQLLNIGVRVVLPKDENILFYWTFGSIVIIIGMVVLTIYTFKS